MASTTEGKQVVEFLRGEDIEIEQFVIESRIYTFLLEKTQGEIFASELRQLKVITSMQHDEWEGLRDNYKRNKFLYDIIFKKDAVEPFIVALEKSDNLRIVKKLQANLPNQQPQPTQPPVPVAQPVIFPAQLPGPNNAYGIATTKAGKYVENYIVSQRISSEKFCNNIYTTLVDNTADTGRFARSLLEQGVIELPQISKDNDELYRIICQKNAIRKCIVALEKSGNGHIVDAMKDEVDRLLRGE